MHYHIDTVADLDAGGGQLLFDLVAPQLGLDAGAQIGRELRARGEILLEAGLDLLLAHRGLTQQAVLPVEPREHGLLEALHLAPVGGVLVESLLARVQIE